MLPIHFNYNFMERDGIPMHNEKYSRATEEYYRQTEVVRKGFFDHSLPIPSHVVLNHINSWETMKLKKGPQQEEASQFGQTGLTCVTMAQRLNRSKFLTLVYYKPSTNKS
uniref:Uncharacterized protein n=1 Tax=Strombidium inclinatum TaxID=197538 RepID=A0A7S3IY46_9SPIT|mmetsp:Transcript_5818/g.9303  ORF Transcript_5818/g.9303 Transcript_5818/m.9303 type:complete len:110 (+) Transcript_5818:1931-2260(+)